MEQDGLPLQEDGLSALPSTDLDQVPVQAHASESTSHQSPSQSTPLATQSSTSLPADVVGSSSSIGDEELHHGDEEEPLLLTEDFGELDTDTMVEERRPTPVKKPPASSSSKTKDASNDGLKHDSKKPAAEVKDGVKKRCVGES
jgi:hypothetical protein